MWKMWKASTNDKYPLNIQRLATKRNASTTTRGMTKENDNEPNTQKTLKGMQPESGTKRHPI